LADLTGMEINVPSGLKNWSICSVIAISVNLYWAVRGNRLLHLYTGSSQRSRFLKVRTLYGKQGIKPTTHRREHGTCS
jgi:hypothetical protein